MRKVDWAGAASKTRQVVIIMISFIILVGFLFAYWLVQHVDRHLVNNLAYQAELIAAELDRDQLRSIQETGSAPAASSLQQLQKHFSSSMLVHNACHHLYLLGQNKNGIVELLVDSGESDGDLAAYVAKTYIGKLALEFPVFSEKEPSTNRLKTTENRASIETLIPIKNQDTDELIAVLGVQYCIEDWNRHLVKTVLPAFLLILTAIAAIIIGTFLMNRHNQTATASPYKALYREKIYIGAVAGIFISVIIAWIAHEAESDARHKAFQQLANDKTTAVSRTFHTFQDVELEALARFYESSEFVSLNEFIGYTNYLLKNPAIASWEWVLPVPARERYRMEAECRNSGIDNFRIWRADSSSYSTETDSYDTLYPVVRITPFEKHKQFLGYDLYSEPLYRAPLQRAKNSRRASCTNPAAFIHGESKSKTIQVFRPVYSANDNTKLDGFASATLRLDKVITTAQPSSAVHLDLLYPNPATNKFEIIASNDYSEHFDTGMRVIRPISVFGTTIYAATHAGPAFVQMHPVQTGWLVALAGLLLTTSLVIISGLVYRKREQLEQMVAERTSEFEEAKQNAELAIDGANLATWDWRVDKHTITCNEKWLQLIGLEDDRLEYPASEWTSFFPERDRPEIRDFVKEHLSQSDEPFEFEQKVTNRDGQTLWLLTRGKVVSRSKDGAPLRVCGTYLDITNRKQAEAALRHSEAFLRALIKTIPDLIWFKSPDGVFLTMNSKFEELYNLSEAEILGKTDYDIVDKELADSFRRSDQAAIKAGKPIVIEEEVPYASDGHIELLETVKTPMYDADNNLIGVLGIARDITERRQAEEERQKLRDQLVQAQKMEAVGRLAGGVAHDLNNLLVPVIGYGEMLVEDPEIQGESRDSIQEMLNAGFRARDLVRQLLAFSRKQALQFKPVCINSIINNYEGFLRRTIPEDIDIKFTLEADLPTIMADVGQIEQIIMNLTVNAVDAMKDGGTLCYETHPSTLDEDYAASHQDVNPGKYVMLVISDTGMGMDDATRERIFEPFYSTKGEQGTGLGLATVFGIVKQHEGHIWVYSEPGGGTMFKVYLPVSDKTPVVVQKNEMDSSSQSGTETILLVEDNEDVRRLAYTILDRNGYTVLVAASGEEAQAFAESNNGPIDLLLTDVVMPGMNGRELHDTLKKKHPDLKVIYMSGYTDNVIVHRGILDDGINFLQKPFTVQGLSSKVRDVLDS